MTEDPAQPVGATPPTMAGVVAPASPDPLGPIREGERLIALDALRGIALLGIFVVNIHFFAMPFMRAWADPGLTDGPRSELFAWSLTKVFFEMKFISMFSLLFGAGLVVQMTRAAAKGRPFAPVYLRRLFVLALFGMAHFVFFWYGDILFLYALIGVLLLFLGRLKPRTLVITAASLIVFASVIGTTCAGLQALMESVQPQSTTAVETTPDVEQNGEMVIADEDQGESLSAPDDGQDVEEAGSQIEADEGESPAAPAPDDGEEAEEAGAEVEADEEESPRGFAAIIASQGNPALEAWEVGEVAAYKDGPFLDALAFRLVTYAYAFFAAFFGYGWHVLAMFLIGAAMMKSGFFLPDKRRWHLRLLLGGFAIRLPIELIGAWLHYSTGFELGWMMLVTSFLHEYGSAALCLGYVGAICLIATTPWIRPVLRPFTSAGRIALSVYLSETLIASTLMYWWGCGWFDDVSRCQQLGLVVVVYLGLIIAATLWLIPFTIGPFEWLWRSLTYWRFQPILRRTKD